MKIIVIICGILYFNVDLAFASPYLNENAQNSAGAQATASSVTSYSSEAWPNYPNIQPSYGNVNGDQATAPVYNNDGTGNTGYPTSSVQTIPIPDVTQGISDTQSSGTSDPRANNLYQGWTQGTSYQTTTTTTLAPKRLIEVWHADGTIEYLESIEEMQRKYPNYGPIKNPEIMPQAKKLYEPTTTAQPSISSCNPVQQAPNLPSQVLIPSEVSPIPDNENIATQTSTTSSDKAQPYQSSATGTITDYNSNAAILSTAIPAFKEDSVFVKESSIINTGSPEAIQQDHEEKLTISTNDFSQIAESRNLEPEVVLPNDGQNSAANMPVSTLVTKEQSYVKSEYNKETLLSRNNEAPAIPVKLASNDYSSITSTAVSSTNNKAYMGVASDESSLEHTSIEKKSAESTESQIERINHFESSSLEEIKSSNKNICEKKSSSVSESESSSESNNISQEGSNQPENSSKSEEFIGNSSSEEQSSSPEDKFTNYPNADKMAEYITNTTETNETESSEALESSEAEDEITEDDIFEMLQNYSGKEPLVWFKTTDSDFLKNILNGNEDWDCIYFFNVKPSKKNIEAMN